MKYTPGPWKEYKKDGRNGYSIHGCNLTAQENQIAHVRGTCIGNTMKKMDEEEAANASLIAASPELAETGSLLLRTVWDTLRHGLTDGQRESLEEAGKEFARILAKAEGRE